MAAKVKDECYHGHIKFQKRDYWIDESHNFDEFIGCYCIGVEVPGANHKPQIFTISVRYYDTDQNEDPESNNDNIETIKRPALFKDEYECRKFMSQLYFPDKAIRIYKITGDMHNHKLFKEHGAYFTRESKIITGV